jgi:catalase
VRGKPELFADHYSQARCSGSASPAEQAHIVNAFRFELTKVQTPAIARGVLSMLANVDPILAEGVAQGWARCRRDAAGHRCAVAALCAIASAVAAGASRRGRHQDRARWRYWPRTAWMRSRSRRCMPTCWPPAPCRAWWRRNWDRCRRPDGGPLDAEISIEAGPAVLYDALIVAMAASAALLQGDADAREFVRLQYRHCKPVLALGEGGLLAAAGRGRRAGSGAMVAVAADALDRAGEFKQALAGHRHFRARNRRRAVVKTPIH